GGGRGAVGEGQGCRLGYVAAVLAAAAPVERVVDCVGSVAVEAGLAAGDAGGVHGAGDAGRGPVAGGEPVAVAPIPGVGRLRRARRGEREEECEEREQGAGSHVAGGLGSEARAGFSPVSGTAAGSYHPFRRALRGAVAPRSPRPDADLRRRDDAAGA